MEWFVAGDVIAVHVNTTRPDSDEEISELLNATLMKESMAETRVKEIQLNEGIVETADKQIIIPQLNGLTIVGATPGHSIIILVYCKTTEKMITFTQLFNSRELHTFLENMLNRLYALIKPRRTDRLETHVRLDEEEILAIEEATGIEGRFSVFVFYYSDTEVC